MQSRIATGMPLAHARQIDFEDGAASRLAIYPYEAIILFHDPINRRESKTGALAGRLGRVKGLKNMRQVFGRNSVPVVTHCNQSIVSSRNDGGLSMDVVIVQANV